MTKRVVDQPLELLPEGLRQVELDWRDAVEAWEDGDLGVAAFCAREGLCQASFYHWRRELERRDAVRASRATQPAVLIEVARTHARAEPPGLWLELTNGRRVLVESGADLELLRGLLDVVDPLC